MIGLFKGDTRSLDYASHVPILYAPVARHIESPVVMSLYFSNFKKGDYTGFRV